MEASLEKKQEGFCFAPWEYDTLISWLTLRAADAGALFQMKSREELSFGKSLRSVELRFQQLGHEKIMPHDWCFLPHVVSLLPPDREQC